MVAPECTGRWETLPSAHWKDFLGLSIPKAAAAQPFTTVVAPDGVKLAVSEYGPPDGKPIILLHGSPGSRLGPVPRPQTLHLQNLRIITYERPGYGKSEPRETAVVATSAGDVLNIANHFGLEEFSVIGRSGGGPHALACAALLPGERLRHVAVKGGVGPPARHLHPTTESMWHAGMAGSNIEIHTASLAERRAKIARIVGNMAIDPAYLYAEWWDDITPADKQLVANHAFARQLFASYTEAIRQGPAGWLYDLEALHNPEGWGFRLDSISIPVLLWHGSDDPFSPIQHARHLAAAIPTAQLVEIAGASHFTAFEAFPKVAAWAVSEGTPDPALFFPEARHPVPPPSIGTGPLRQARLVASR